MVKVKICGITNEADAIRACEAGADMLGLVFVESSPRCVSSKIARDIASKVRDLRKGSICLVGLFKDADRDLVGSIVKECGLDHVQLHGDETPEYCAFLKKSLGEVKIIKVFKVKKGILPCGVYTPEDYTEADYYLFDAYHPELAGGTGKPFEWAGMGRQVKELLKPFLVAGGLNPGNVADAMRFMHPYGVDVSSGVESAPGKKDAELLKEFIKNAKR